MTNATQTAAPEPSAAGTNTVELRVRLYRTMQLIRRTEEILMEEYHPADEMRCPIHFCVGQEAPAAVLAELLRPDDTVFSHHRSHGYYLAKGAPLDAMVAEFYGKSTGANGGLAGSQELSHEQSRFYSGTILSGAFAMAAGSAFANRYSGSDAIAVGVIGDGGMEEGIVFETLNLAAVRRLPVLFLCENNGYSIHSPLEERSLSSHLVERAKVFGVPAHLFDGNDAEALFDEMAPIVASIRAGNGPAFVEVMTYRHCGHVGPEDDDHYGYRPKAERLKWRQRDPITLLRDVLSADDGIAGELDAIDGETDAMVLAAIDAAKEAPFPDFDKALELNLPQSYAPVVDALIDGVVGDFDPCQEETKLKPY